MPVTTRVALIALVLLLSACSRRAPSPQPSYTPPVSSSSYQGGAEDVLFRALGLVGTPYRYGGNTPEGGFDCSGLVGFVYRDAAGLQLPRSTRELIRLPVPPVPRQALSAGDLVFFATSGGGQVSHAGIYVGEGRFVHAPSSGGTVRLDSLSSRYWQQTYLDARRVLVAGTH